MADAVLLACEIKDGSVRFTPPIISQPGEWISVELLPDLQLAIVSRTPPDAEDC